MSELPPRDSPSPGTHVHGAPTSRDPGPSGLPANGTLLNSQRSHRPSSQGLPRDWLPTVVAFLAREPIAVRVVVAEIRGSTPREPGAFMLVGRGSVEGSIGGGQLEWEAIAAARELLADATVTARVNKVVLAADVGQCCGGAVSLWLERLTRDDLDLLRSAADAGAHGCAVLSCTIRGAVVEHKILRHAGMAVSARIDAGRGPVDATIGDATRGTATRSTDTMPDADARLPDLTNRLLREPRQRAYPILTSNAAGEFTFIERLDDEFPAVWLYGAGHVGQALARILTELPLRLTWIDSRAELFPETVAGGVRILSDPDTLATVSEAPVGAHFVVMSHSHPLDFSLCHALLERNDFAWLGLIGSASKAARFRSRLRRAGLGADVIGKLVCPIGVEGIESKWPAAIAVAVAAQLMQRISAAGVGQLTGSTRVAATRPISERVEAASGHVDAVPGGRTHGDDCSPENCATCGSAAGRSGTVTS